MNSIYFIICISILSSQTLKSHPKTKQLWQDKIMGISYSNPLCFNLLGPPKEGCILWLQPGDRWGRLMETVITSPAVILTQVKSMPLRIHLSQIPAPPLLMMLFSHSVMSNSATPWTAARQASLYFPISWSLLKLLSIESVMPSNHLVRPLSSPSPPALNLSQHQGLFKWDGSLHQVAKVLELQL